MNVKREPTMLVSTGEHELTNNTTGTNYSPVKHDRGQNALEANKRSKGGVLQDHTVYV